MESWPMLANAFLLMLGAQLTSDSGTPGQARVLLLELDDASERLVGHGPVRWIEERARQDGTLLVWIESELDAFLRVEDAQGELLGEDDDSGGRPLPYLALELRGGHVLRVAAAAARPGEAGALRLVLVERPESEATRAAGALARQREERVRDLVRAGEHAEARALLEESAAALVACEGGGQSELVEQALGRLGRLAYELGALELALSVCAPRVERLARVRPPPHPELLTARLDLASMRFLAGDAEGARSLLEEVLAARERTLDEAHPDLLQTRQNLAIVLERAGELERARELFEEVLAVRTRALGPEHPSVHEARQNLASHLLKLGDAQGARVLLEGAARELERALGPESEAVLFARRNLGHALLRLQEGEAALAELEAVLRVRQRTLPAAHPALIETWSDVAVVRYALGDHAGALELFEGLHAELEGLLPSEHEELLSLRDKLARLRRESGDVAGARTLQEQVLAVLAASLAHDDPRLCQAKIRLGDTLAAEGRLLEARALHEDVLEQLAPRLAPEDALLLEARTSLATTMLWLGDFVGARAQLEEVLAARERTHLPEDGELLAARGNLAGVLGALGEHAQARILREEVLAAYERTLPPEHPSILTAANNLGVTCFDLGEHEEGRRHFERALAGFERSLPADHPDLLMTMQSYAAALAASGDLAAARPLEERVLAARLRFLPADARDVIVARHNLLLTNADLGELEAALALLASQLEALHARALSAGLVAAREAREILESDAPRVSLLLSLVDPTDERAREALFELVETRRVATLLSPRAAPLAMEEPELAALAEQAGRARAELGALVARAAHGPSEELRDELARAAAERDRAEAKLRRELATRGRGARRVGLAELAASLPEGSAAVGYLAYRRWSFGDEADPLAPSVPSLLAHVLRPDGALTRVELGPLAELDALAEAWREAVGSPLAARGRGLAAAGAAEVDEEELGSRLRALLLDPVLAAAGGETRTVFVAADELIHLLPLDALPSSSGRVGDRLRVVIAPALGELALEPRTDPGAQRLLVIGGVDYEAATEPVLLARAGPGEESADRPRSGAEEAFAPLPGTLLESERVGALFTRSFGADPMLLVGAGAGASELARLAPSTRWVHLATHGWFAPEDEVAPAATEERRWTRMSTEQTITGFAPMTRCGLALAGANRGRDALGRVAGILTAEELCALDLSSCELAVLSACETNVGIRRAGQGIQSLQAALHAAGARTAITSLWKVEDEATRDLMERFYTCLWQEKRPKAEALCRAKQELRAAGRPVRDWAGWVLSGDPE